MYLMGYSCPLAYRPYRLETSTLDVAGMFRGLDDREESVLPLTSIFFNRSDNVPVAISEAGKRSVQESKDVRDENVLLEKIRSQILVTHSSHY